MNTPSIQSKSTRVLVDLLIGWPERVAAYFAWLAPLVARLTVGGVFLWSGWGKLSDLPIVVENFIGWGIPFPKMLAPFVSGVEFIGGILLLLGLFTRIAAVPLAIVMIIAIISAKWDEVDSVETLLGFDESAYSALFLWLAVAGPGLISLDHLLQRLVGAGSTDESKKRKSSRHLARESANSR
jgi:putative oxidoreductase